jgi:uncharacterized protein YifN (PemK superfamily)
MQDAYIYSHIASWMMGHVLKSQFFPVELSKNRLFYDDRRDWLKSHFISLFSTDKLTETC